jgi:XTP/dITP diphosphohydrolase
MQRVLIATSNPHKLREIRTLLAGVPVQLFSLRDFPSVEEAEESGATFQENARAKVLHYARPDMLTVAEDSGLVIDAFGGDPGVRSARFLRPDASYPERFREIYRRFEQDPQATRSARFVCALAVARDGRIAFETTGIINGEIADAPRGEGGFGYDPIFYYPPYRRTLAEVTREQKLAVAHRGQAFRAFAGWLMVSG